MFRVTTAFADLQDGGYIYKVGDQFPRPGVSVSEKRLRELSSNSNRRGMAVIAIRNTRKSPSEVKENAEESRTGISPPKTSKAKGKPRKG